jgi:eukaryotic-like serine/threonine-protein kinase
VTAREAPKYETLGVLGRGGMATVFLGRSRGAAGFRRLVAVKRPHMHVRTDAALTASMKHEASLAARLHHPNVVRVIDVVEEDGALVLVLDYVEGGTLSDLQEKALEALSTDARTRARLIVRIMLDVAAGLDAAHRAVDDEGVSLGIVHRDVTPSNVLVGTDGIARLTDFGIAKALEGGPELTETGVLKGKLAYMAPEYVEHQRADAAADQFSLAVVTWEGLAGRRLFRGSNEIETLKRVALCKVPSLAVLEPQLAPLEPVLARALSRAPGERFASVRELAEALEEAARAADLVASHGEIGELVERALRDDLEARRRLVRGPADGDEESPRPASPSSHARRGRDDVPTASLVNHASLRTANGAAGTDAGGGAPSAAARTPKTHRRALALLLVLIIVAIGVGAGGAFRGQTEARSREPSARASAAPAETNTTGTSEVEPSVASGVSLTAETELVDAGVSIASAASDAPPSSSRPSRTRAGSGTGRSPSPAGRIVPRKAPPNPYVR